MASEAYSNTEAGDDVILRKINTFVFLDLETSNLESFDKPKIIELCMVAIHRNVLYNQTDASGQQHQAHLPRVLDKITLCFNPNKSVGPRTYDLTGLDHFNIAESAKEIFDEDAAKLMQLFLRRQQQPVCLVAHNGDRFDFRLLRTELKKIEQSLDDGVLCADSLIGFYETDLESNPDTQKSQQHTVSVETPIKRARYEPGAVPTTPSKQGRRINSPLSYSLENVYMRTFGQSPLAAHTAEGDVMSLIRICQARGKRICQWMDNKAVKLNDIELYYIPSPPRHSKKSLQY
ncbi:three prime repair exonuclease 2-like [Amphiura filiformis]|uniref:three prime repair exonuclease 2-like n=1 Tax=Amphiura filiformis TaxID=82378 RepID=UPI003B2161B0